MILPVVVHGCEALSDEAKLRVFEKNVLRMMHRVVQYDCDGELRQRPKKTVRTYSRPGLERTRFRI